MMQLDLKSGSENISLFEYSQFYDSQIIDYYHYYIA